MIYLSAGSKNGVDVDGIRPLNIAESDVGHRDEPGCRRCDGLSRRLR